MDKELQRNAIASLGIDLKTALNAYAAEHPRHREVTYNGFFTGPYYDDYKWYVSFPALLVGGTSSDPESPTFVSLEGKVFDTPEGLVVGQRGDFAQCLFVARPDTEAIIPIVVALKLQGRWSPIAVVFDDREIKFKPVAMNAPEDVDAFIAQNVNTPMYPSIVLRYQSPDRLGADTDLTWQQGRGAARPFVVNEQGYLARFTHNPTLLGSNKIGPPRSCPPNTLCQSEAGEMVVFEDLVKKLDPNNDIGFLSPWIPFGRVP